MQFLPTSSSYNKPVLTQGDQLNRIKVIRKRNKQNKNGVAKEPTINSISPTFLGSYPKLHHIEGSSNERGTGLDLKEIYNIHEPLTEDAISTSDSTEITENYNRFSSDTDDPALIAYGEDDGKDKSYEPLGGQLRLVLIIHATDLNSCFPFLISLQIMWLTSAKIRQQDFSQNLITTSTCLVTQAT